MIELQPPFRPAVRADAAALTELVDFASEGFAPYLWGNLAGPGGDAWAVGRERVLRETGGFSYRNTTVVEQGGRVVAGLVGYPLADAPEPVPDDLPAMFRPLQELEDLAPATWYVNVLAAYPEQRGKGYGTALLGLAERFAADTGRRGLSIIVSDTNAGARRLYERCGYAEIARRAKVKEGWRNDGTAWVLLTKPA